MNVAEVAFGSTGPRGRPVQGWLIALLAVGGTTAALVALALLYAGPPTYEDIARANGFDRATFHVGTASARQAVRYDLPALVALHTASLAYVLGDAPATPRDPTTGGPLFSLEEQRHLADVRSVFGTVRAAAVAGLVAVIASLLGAARRGSAGVLLAVRGAALSGGLCVAAVGAIAAVAFVPAFLAFHYLFFPQGNFLFDPATSNLIALYPEAYWYGVTLRIAASFPVLAGLVAGTAHLALRMRGPR